MELFALILTSTRHFFKPVLPSFLYTIQNRQPKILIIKTRLNPLNRQRKCTAYGSIFHVFLPPRASSQPSQGPLACRTVSGIACK